LVIWQTQSKCFVVSGDEALEPMMPSATSSATARPRGPLMPRTTGYVEWSVRREARRMQHLHDGAFPLDLLVSQERS
jgi:hypothetical protein